MKRLCLPNLLEKIAEKLHTTPRDHHRAETIRLLAFVQARYFGSRTCFPLLATYSKCKA
jgi:hypothetical protein